MKSLKDFNIQFSGLKIGKHVYEYTITDLFFKHFEFEEFSKANILVSVVLDKKTTFFELYFSHKGTVNVACDVTNIPFDLPVEGQLKLLVKFAEEYNDDNDEILILPHGEFQVNIAQYIYEMIVLSMPAKRIHPDVENGKIEVELLDFEDEPIDETDINTDPRWDKLKDFLTN